MDESPFATPNPEIPAFAELAADPEIAPLLNFDPVPRKVIRPNGWTADPQRELIARIAAAGTLQAAVWQMGKHATGAEALYRNPDGASFRQAWDAALIIGRRRNGLDSRPPFAGAVPGISRRARLTASSALEGLPGQIVNEMGEWEDERSVNRRGADARDSITMKLLNARRLYLQEICSCPGKRAAFEILTELPIDWDKAARLEEQADEPYSPANLRQPDMLLTAENGWVGGLGYGPDRIGELRAAIDEYREEQGMEPVDWDGEREE